jgi:hypothetical protein
MRTVLGILGLLMALALVATLAKKPLSAGAVPAAPDGQQQPPPQHLPPQLQQSLENTLQQARPMPEGL